jgi:ATP adenylyltransferase
MTEHIFAPWRSDFILGPKEKKCIFCRMAAADDHDRQNYVLTRGSESYVVLNRYPYTSGHLMIVPNRHLSKFERLKPKTLSEVMLFAQKAVSALQEEYAPQGFNVGLNLGRTAGAGVQGHVHLHVVPRWNGDSSFVATIGETRVISFSLESVFRSLKKHFR